MLQSQSVDGTLVFHFIRVLARGGGAFDMFAALIHRFNRSVLVAQRRLWCVRWVVLVLSATTGSQKVFAEASGISSNSSLQIEKPENNNSDRPVLGGFVRFESMQYPTRLVGQENLSQNNMMEAGFAGASYLRSTPSIGARADISAGRSLNLNYSYFSVYELSATWTSANDQFGISLGRHIESWNDADEIWNLNLWQPTFSMDALRIQQQGILGLHARATGTYLQMAAFLSPAFIPTTTPEIADRNGEITSESRWFRSIPTQSEIIGRPTRLYYRVEIPQIQELISQPAAGAQLRIGRLNSGAWARVAYTNKAMNTLNFKYDAAFRTAPDQQARGEVELRPIAHRHQIGSADMGFAYEGGEVALSHVQDRPDLATVSNFRNDEGLMTDFIQQAPRPIKATSIRWDQNITVPFARWPLKARLAYLKAEVEPTKDYDSRGGEQSSLLPHRLNYSNAVTIEGKSALTERWFLGLKYLRDFDQVGSQWNAELEYRSKANWTWVIGGDSLGVDDASPANSDTRFLNYYRQNDRVYGGLTYVF